VVNEIRKTKNEYSDLIETFKIMNGPYNINRDLFFQLDEGGRRGHGQKLFKRRFRVFTARSIYASAVLEIVILSIRLSVYLSVCPSVRPSHACFVTKRKNIQLKF